VDTRFAADGYVAEFGLVEGVEKGDGKRALGDHGDFVIVGVGRGEFAFVAVEDLVGGTDFFAEQVLCHGLM